MHSDSCMFFVPLLIVDLVLSLKLMYLVVERAEGQGEMTWSQRLEFRGGNGGLDLLGLSGICSYMENSELSAPMRGGFLIAEAPTFCKGNGYLEFWEPLSVL